MTADTNIYSLYMALILVAGFLVAGAIVGFTIIAERREKHDRSLFPWGPRNRVEQAKAHTEVLEEHLKQEAIEVKRLAIGYQRTAVMKAIDDEDMEEVQRLGLPSAEPPKQDGYRDYESRNY